jgi:hypothetical protein
MILLAAMSSRQCQATKRAATKRDDLKNQNSPCAAMRGGFFIVGAACSVKPTTLLRNRLENMSEITIKGLVRFSYPSKSGFRLSKGGPNHVHKTLYDPERLERRFAFFEMFCLRSLALQRDPDFQVGILVGESLPNEARVRLTEMLEGFENAQIITLPPMEHYNAVATAFQNMPDRTDAEHTVTFRLDDDDAMHAETVGRLRHLTHSLLPLRNRAEPFAIAFNRGFYFDTTNPDQMITECYEKTPLGVGMALVAPKDSRQNVFRRNHRAVGQHYNCYTEVTKPMFIRTVHQDNDSSAEATGHNGRMPQAKIERSLLNNFGVNLDMLKGLME